MDLACSNNLQNAQYLPLSLTIDAISVFYFRKNSDWYHNALFFFCLFSLRSSLFSETYVITLIEDLNFYRSPKTSKGYRPAALTPLESLLAPTGWGQEGVASGVDSRETFFHAFIRDSFERLLGSCKSLLWKIPLRSSFERLLQYKQGENSAF